MLHTQYVFVYGDTCILVINFAPPKVKSWLRHCLEVNSYELFCGTEDLIIIFMVLNIVLENYFEDVLFLVD